MKKGMLLLAAVFRFTPGGGGHAAFMDSVICAAELSPVRKMGFASF